MPGRRVYVSLVAVFVLFSSARILPFFTGGVWLANHRVVGTATVHSDGPILDSHAAAVADAIQRLEKRNVWRGPDRSTRVLLITDGRTYQFLARLVGRARKSQGFALARTVVISRSFVDSMSARWGPSYAGTILDGDLAHVVAHEMTHIALMKRLGRRTFVRLPIWKTEGLAEHYSSEPETPSRTELARRVRHLLGPDGPRAGVRRAQYIEASLLVSYLILEEEWTIDEILNGPTDAAQLVAAMKTWAATSEGGRWMRQIRTRDRLLPGITAAAPPEPSDRRSR